MKELEAEADEQCDNTRRQRKEPKRYDEDDPVPELPATTSKLQGITKVMYCNILLILKWFCF